MVAGNGRKFSISYDFNYTVKVEPTYYYILSSINMDYCLDIEGASQKNEANVQIYLKNRTDAQKFSFSKCGGYYYIVCKCSGKVIDVKHSGKDPGTNIWQNYVDFKDMVGADNLVVLQQEVDELAEYM